MAAPDAVDRMVARAQHIVRSLGKTNTKTDDMHILSTFDQRFYGTNVKEEVGQEPSSSQNSDVEECPPPVNNRPRARNSSVRSYSHERANNLALDEAQSVITQWNNGYSCRRESLHGAQKWIFEGSKRESSQFLDAVDELTRQLSSTNVRYRDPGALERAKNLYNLALERLVEEFQCMVDKNSERIDSNSLLYSAASEYTRDPVNQVADPETESSDGDDDEDGDVPVAYPLEKTETRMVLVSSQVVEDLAEIAKRLTVGGYKGECINIYVGKRKEILEKSLYELGVESVTRDELLEMKWEVQSRRIGSWNRAMSMGMKVLFVSEKQLCDEVFSSPLSIDIFNDIGQGAMMLLLSFANAIACSPRSPEKLPGILNMYEVLRDIRPELDVVFAGESGARVRLDAKGTLIHLGEVAAETFSRFEEAIRGDVSRLPIRDGDVHMLNRYVMNYIKLLCDYTETLNEVLKLSGDDTQLPENMNDVRSGMDEISSLGMKLKCWISALQYNLEVKSNRYEDPALKFFFLMNNQKYISQKVIEPEIRTLVGGDFVRRHSRRLEHAITRYRMTAWGELTALLLDSGMTTDSGTLNGVSSAVVKRRFENFNAAFDKAVRSESRWVVYDDSFRVELIAVITETLVIGYKSFLGRYENSIGSCRAKRKYIKYSTSEELEACLQNLFRGHIA